MTSKCVGGREGGRERERERKKAEEREAPIHLQTDVYAISAAAAAAAAAAAVAFAEGDPQSFPLSSSRQSMEGKRRSSPCYLMFLGLPLPPSLPTPTILLLGVNDKSTICLDEMIALLMHLLHEFFCLAVLLPWSFFNVLHSTYDIRLHF